jgi:RNA 3'-terminal phosphate cyclase (ATP)
MITLDGSRGEGGGQILRTALTLSLLTGRPFRLSRIRANRSRPGLRPQHLKAVEVAAAISRARVVGAAVNSRDLTFEPGDFQTYDIHLDIGTAGSTSLVLQTIHLPIALNAEIPVRVRLKGGTFNPKAPAFTFLDETWRPFLASIGMPLTLSMSKAGFYPKGGGLLDAVIEPARPRAFRQTTRGRLIRIRGIAGVANLPDQIAERMIARASFRLADLNQSTGTETTLEAVRWPSVGQGAAIALIAEHEGGIPATFVGLGERGKPSDRVADEAVDELLGFEAVENAAVDPHSADQIPLPLIFAEGGSAYSVSTVTEHFRTNVETIRAFLDRSITVEEPTAPELPGIVTID